MSHNMKPSQLTKRFGEPPIKDMLKKPYIEHDRAFAEPKSIDDVDRMFHDKKDKSPDCPKKCVCINGWLVIVIFALGLFFGLFIRVNLVV